MTERAALPAWRRSASRLVHLFLPPACHGCGDPLPRDGSRLCPRCRTRLREPAHPRCARCGAPRGTGRSASRGCPECEDWPDALVRARCAALFAPPADALVHGLKFGGWRELAPVMAERMARVLPRSALPPGAPVVPVPTTPARKRERGYNQAELLARELAARIGRPFLPALARREGRATQISLHRAERLANVRDAFHGHPEHKPRLRGRSVLLVDDVLTTGATACAAAEALTAMGAAEVSVVAFARALPDAGG